MGLAEFLKGDKEQNVDPRERSAAPRTREVAATPLTKTPLVAPGGESGATITTQTPQRADVPAAQEAIPSTLSPLEYAFTQRVVGEGKLWPTYGEIPQNIKGVIRALNQAYEQITLGSLPPTPAENTQMYKSILAQLTRVDEIVRSREDVPNKIAALLNALRVGGEETRQIADRVAAFVMLEALLRDSAVYQHLNTRPSVGLEAGYVFNDNNRRNQGDSRLHYPIIDIAAGVKRYRGGHQGDSWGDGSGELMDKFAQAIPNWPAYADVLSRFK